MPIIPNKFRHNSDGTTTIYVESKYGTFEPYVDTEDFLDESKGISANRWCVGSPTGSPVFYSGKVGSLRKAVFDNTLSNPRIRVGLVNREDRMNHTKQNLRVPNELPKNIMFTDGEDEFGKYSEFTLKGTKFKIDLQDREFISSIWSLSVGTQEHTSYLYATESPVEKRIAIHRIITRCPDKMVVDHLDGDGTNNRRYNLQVCNFQMNSRNRRKRKDSKSAYKGVKSRSYISKKTGKEVVHYYPYIIVQRKHIHLGSFKCPVEAAEVRDIEEIRMFGESLPLRALNFPDKIEKYRERIEKNAEEKRDGGTS